MSLYRINAYSNSSALNAIKYSGSDSVTGAGSGFSGILNAAVKKTDLDSIFEAASQQYNVPVSLLKAVAKVESNFNPKAVSRCGAQGVMQLMPGTAKGLGVSDSFDPEQNIMGGAKYLSQLLSKYNGNTQAALAAYNAGPGTVAKHNGDTSFAQGYINKVLSNCGSDIQAGAAGAASAAEISSGTDKTNLLQLLLNMELQTNPSDSGSDDSYGSALLNFFLYRQQSMLAGMDVAQHEYGI